MEIELGKYYRAENGKVLGPIVARITDAYRADTGNDPYIYGVEADEHGHYRSYTKYGEYVKDAPNEYDLLEEVAKP